MNSPISGHNSKKNVEELPTGLQKIHKYGLWNIIFEVDVCEMPDKLNLQQKCALLEKWISWAHKNIDTTNGPKVFVNVRDAQDAFPSFPKSVLELVDFLGKLPDNLQPFGMIFEDARGVALPEQCGAWTRFIRKVMTANNWDGHLLGHIHEKWGYAEASQIEVRQGPALEGKRLKNLTLLLADFQSSNQHAHRINTYLFHCN